MKSNNFPVQSDICGTYKQILQHFKVGEKVTPRQTLCFVNDEPIQTKQGGIIKKILCKNGEQVVAGTTLFMISCKI